MEKTNEFDKWLKKLKDNRAKPGNYGKSTKSHFRNMKKMKTTKFDIAEYLDDDDMIAEYLNNVLEEGETSDIIAALGHVAKAQGMSKIAAETGLSRPSLYKALSHGSKPQFETILKVLRAVGGHLNVKTIQPQ
ncbi:putative addiction module antidote protein [Imperialibacter roseus]|uniref:Addiction module antidote protein n=2 Tax=Imperialibacter TaxID=1649461 RepID=A0ABZ0IVM1_9BACT|nr:addiction module antidote protein [Imperialibacter roseus]WOK08562.1 putative addiction module antidote protein [Imperialibacter roseus]